MEAQEPAEQSRFETTKKRNEVATLNQWTDPATGVGVATFDYTFQDQFTLKFMIRADIDGSVSEKLHVSISTTSADTFVFFDESLLALAINGAAPIVLDTSVGVYQGLDKRMHERIESAYPVKDFIAATSEMTTLEIRVENLKVNLSSEAIAKMRAFLAIATTGFTTP